MSTQSNLRVFGAPKEIRDGTMLPYVEQKVVRTERHQERSQKISYSGALTESGGIRKQNFVPLFRQGHRLTEENHFQISGLVLL